MLVLVLRLVLLVVLLLKLATVEARLLLLLPGVVPWISVQILAVEGKMAGLNLRLLCLPAREYFDGRAYDLATAFAYQIL